MTSWLDTLRALLQPRRSIPIAVVALPLLWAQWEFSHRAPLPVLVAVGMVVAFVALGPAAWRALFPPGIEPGSHPLRLIAYGLVGAVPTVLGSAVPALLELREPFLARSVNTLVIGALFWVGGWGLARDIDLERGLLHEQKRSERLEREAERAQLLAMKAHLDPHFLFNTLNAIAEWCQEDPAVAERAILRLSSILREVLGGIGASAWPLRREIALVRDVWALHHSRDPSWFTVACEIDETTLDQPMPPLTLLPLAENAIKHGPAQGHRGVLFLGVARRGSSVVITLSNPGPYKGPRPTGAGLDVVHKRLSLAWSGRARCTLRGEDGRTVAEVEVPAGSGPDGWVA